MSIVTPSGLTQCCDVVPAFDTVTVTDAVLVLPDASVARVVMVCDPSDSAVVPSAYVQLVVPDAAAHAPPSTATSTRETLASSDAEPLTVTVPLTVAPLAGDEMATDGAVVSATAFCTVTVSDVVRTLPAVSVARAVSEC